MTSATTPPALDQPYEGAPWGAAYRRFWKKGVTFTGRASRAEFWRAWVLTTGTVVALYLLSTVLSLVSSGGVINTSQLGLLLIAGALLYGLAITIPSIAVTIRRLHDTNQSGAMYFVSFIPFIGGLIMLFLLAQPARPEGARFDLVPTGYAPTTQVPAVRSSYGEIPAPPVASSAPFAGSAPVVPPVPAPPASAAPLAPPVPPASSAFATAPFAGSAPLAPAVVPPAPEGVPPASGIPAPFAPASAPAAASPAAPLAPAPVAVSGVSGAVAPIPGIPGRPSVPIAPAASSAPVDAPDLDSTRMVAPSSAADWTLELPDGRRVSVNGAVSLGRDPASEHGGILVPIVDPARSMSKTHALFELTPTGVIVTDLHSTNGTRIESDVAPTVSVAPGLPTPVPEGATVVLGEYAVHLSRR